jgi:hypothetical protein
MPHIFTLHRESLKPNFAIYVVVAKSENDTYLYVGKTGDNRKGCNPIISRCGNHFSYNDIHSQIRNKIPNHEERDYTYVFEHFDEYPNDEALRRVCINRINEMERWLNQEIKTLAESRPNVKLLNEYSGKSYISPSERAKRASFRTPESTERITALIVAVHKRVWLTPPSNGPAYGWPFTSNLTLIHLKPLRDNSWRMMTLTSNQNLSNVL